MKAISTFVLISTVLMTQVSCTKSYEPTWDSLATAPIPEWWEDGKFGIFIHWGPYSVAGYKYRHRGYAEAITADLYRNPQNYVEFMTDKFGAAPPEFGYKDMVPLFRAENWDPAEWAKLFREAGAKYVIPTAEHHDGFMNWDSDLSPWSATNKGPMRDLIGDLGKAVRNEGLIYGVSYHRERHPGRFAPEDAVQTKPFDQVAEEIRRVPEAASLYGPFEYSDEFIQDYVARWKELEAKYEPDFMWLDDIPIFRNGAGDPQVVKYENAIRQMMADYLNNATAKGKEVYFNNKGKTANWPVGVGCLEADNLHLETIGPRWQNPATLGTSYAYMAEEERLDLYKTPTELVRLLCDVVSKNGNLLLNIGPRADGTIPEGMKIRLLEMGRWLKKNGEAIYGTKPWILYGEYSGEQVEESDVHYNKHSMRIHEEEVRYTAKPGIVYAHVINRDGDSILLKSFREFSKGIKDVQILESGNKVSWENNDDGLLINYPQNESSEHVTVLEIKLLD
jgi:alpha-L-fucosidase